MIWIRGLFWLAAAYGIAIGLGFLVLGDSVFERFAVEPPNHPGYYEFPALLLIVFGVMFARIALDPIAHRSWIWFGVALKGSYAGVVLTHQFTDGVPSMWLPFAFADLGFLVLFVVAWVTIGGLLPENHGEGTWG